MQSHKRKYTDQRLPKYKVNILTTIKTMQEYKYTIKYIGTHT